MLIYRWLEEKEGEFIKKVVLNILLLVLCFALSILICMNIVDDILILVSTSLWVSMGARCIITVIMYFLIKDLFNKRIEARHINILFIVYILFIFSLTFFKGSYSAGNKGFNINPLNIIEDFKNSSNTLYLLFGNFFVYIPVGMYLKYKYPTKKNLKLILMFILIITILEVCQGIFSMGSFDINDIILNSIGFCSGLYIFKFIINQIKRRCE